MLKFWAQSFLLGVPKIIVGFRNKNGILQRIEELETKNIPLMIKKRRKQSWDGNLCINFASNFLECRLSSVDLGKRLMVLLGLKATITSEGVWRITRKVRSPIIEVFKIEESGQGDILSLEFTQWRNRVAISEGVQTASLDQDVQVAT